MPPGTGDVPLTVFQSIPIDGIIIVATPQDLVSMIVEKALKMAVMMEIPVLGLVENLSYIRCPDCGREIRPFGTDDKLNETAKKYQLPVLARIPISKDVAQAADGGLIELFEGDFLDKAADAVEDTAK
jgi:Mrp family chromosome partitioning ATPase